jgi:hypothetical protein
MIFKDLAKEVKDYFTKMKALQEKFPDFGEDLEKEYSEQIERLEGILKEAKKAKDE